LIDEGRDRECVQQEDCTCIHHDRVYMPDEIRHRPGQKWFVFWCFQLRDLVFFSSV